MNLFQEIKSILLNIFLLILSFTIGLKLYQLSNPYSFPSLFENLLFVLIIVGPPAILLKIPYLSLLKKLNKILKKYKIAKQISKKTNKIIKLFYKVLLFFIKLIIQIISKIEKNIQEKGLEKKEVPIAVISFLFRISLIVYLIYLISLELFGFWKGINTYFLVLVIVLGAISILFSKEEKIKKIK